MLWWWVLACADREASPPLPEPTTPPAPVVRPGGTRDVTGAGAVLTSDRGGATVGAADLDGDGVDDLLVGTPGDDAGPGRFFAARSPLDAAVDVPAWDGETDGDQAGYAYTTGDVDGDGAIEAWVGAFLGDRAAPEGGVTYRLDAPFDGGALAAASTVLVDGDDNDHSGLAIAVGNWLGKPTLAIGACMEDGGAADAGAVFLVPGPPGGESDLRDAVRVTGENAGDASGSSLGAADLDGDGLTDLVDGAWLEDSGGADAGAVYLLLGPISADRPVSTADLELVGEAPGDFAGSPCGAAGDLTGDGLADLVVGAWFADGASPDGGAVYVVDGTRRGTVPLAEADAAFHGPLAGAHWGPVAAAPGDLDGDGADDLLAGAPEAAVGGLAGVWYGPLTGALAAPDLTFSSGQAGDGLGLTVAWGDLDGDGRSDAVVGASVGAAWVFFAAGL